MSKQRTPRPAAQRTGNPGTLAMLLRAEPTMRDGRDGPRRARTRAAQRAQAVALGQR
jgi:hypothetical protein